MKLSKTTYETLRSNSFAASAAEKHVADLECYAFESRICDDWSSFIDALSSKILRFESEVVLLAHLSSSVLENEYKKHFHSSSISTTVRLLDALSTKITVPPTANQSTCLQVSFSNIYMYLVRKLMKSFSETSENYKLIVSRLARDVNQLCSILDFCLHTQSATTQINTVQRITFIKLLRKLIQKQAHMFRSAASRIEETLIHSFEKPSATSSIQLDLLPADTRIEVIQLLSVLPLCCDGQSYEAKVKHLLNNYINNFFYGFLLICRGGEEASDIRRVHAFEDDFNLSPRFVFDWGYLSVLAQRSSSEASIAYTHRMKILSQLIIQTVTNLQVDSEHTWNLQGYLNKLEIIFSKDAKQLESSKTAKPKTHNPNAGDKIILNTEYATVSFKVKAMSLKVLNLLLQTQQSGFLKYSEWLYDNLYFIISNYSSNELVMKAFLKTCTCGVMTLGPLLGEFIAYVLFQSSLKPMNLILSHYGSYLRQFKHATNTETSAAIDEMNFRKEKKGKRHTGNQLSLQQDPRSSDRIVIREAGVVTLRMNSSDHGLIEELNEAGYRKVVHSILVLIKAFFAKCASHVLDSDDLATITATFSKILSYPRVFAFAPCQNKKIFLSCLSDILAYPLLNCLETSPLVGEFDIFLTHYSLAETEQTFVHEATRIKNTIFTLSQNKRLTFVDNSIDLQNYIEKRYQQVQHDFSAAAASQVTQTPPLTQVPQPKPITAEQSNKTFTKQQQHNPVDFSLKRTLTEMMQEGNNNSSFIEKKPEKKLAVEEKKQEEQSTPERPATQTTPSVPLFAKPAVAATSAPIFFGKPDANKNTLFSSSLFTPVVPSSAAVTSQQVNDTALTETKKNEIELEESDDEEMILNPVLDSD